MATKAMFALAVLLVATAEVRSTATFFSIGDWGGADLQVSDLCG
jgi:hypothetical protein